MENITEMNLYSIPSDLPAKKKHILLLASISIEKHCSYGNGVWYTSATI
jgi:hypothetical protein